jgi:hypothetical protein
LRQKARLHFNDAVQMAETWFRFGGGAEALVLKSEACSQLALEGSTSADRSSFWRIALKTLDSATDRQHDVAEAYAFVAVDLFSGCSQRL